MLLCIGIYLLGICYITWQKKGGKLSWCSEKEARQMFLIICAANTIACLLFVTDLWNAKSKNGNILVRNTYGKGDKTESLEVSVGKKLSREQIDILVEEQKYTSAEIQTVFKQAIEALDSIILNDNKSMDEVQYDLNLPRKFPGQPIQIEWELDRYDVLNIYGEIQPDKVTEEGTLVELKGHMLYGHEEALYVTTVKVIPRISTKKEQTISQIQSLIGVENDKSKEKELLALPTELNGTKIKWQKKRDKRGYGLIVLGVVAAGSILLLKKQNAEKEYKERTRQMMVDYPELINKLTLLLGAGMTVKNAWKKIVLDYLDQRTYIGKRHAYEEMQVTLREMHSGVTESESYERFGRRCKVQSYLKLGALLSQNLKKGTKGLSDLLNFEAEHAFEERKRAAKKAGEEASTKLLIPMFFMLAIVLVIVIVPAFMSMQI